MWDFVQDRCEMRTKNQAWIAFQLYASLVYVIMKAEEWCPSTLRQCGTLKHFQ